jgi:putative membrane-bound dehydrogenase-like protein
MSRSRQGKILAATMVAVLLASTASTRAQVPHNQDEPPGPALSPAQAIAKMTVPPGFSVELVAAEPDLVNPVSMTFDERGRIWVTESLEYPRREPGPGRDRVKVFQDTDGDGTADQHSIFADGLNIPSGIAVGHGGVWVANSPDLLFYPDADRDAVPDGPPEVIVTGFGRADTHELPNSLTWGPDGWLYGWNGVFNPAEVTSNNGTTYKFTCAIFRVHPRTREFQVWCEGTSNPWGIALNENGDLFSSACVIDHLWHLVESGYYIRQGGPYPAHAWPMGSIVDYKHQKAAYCGITFYDSDAYPAEFRGKLYMGNIHGNAVNADALERDGSTYRGTSQADFLSAHDAWFMPVVQKTGPDGSLHVLDWYDRYHCYQDANRDPAGIDRLKGRLYRVRYQQTPRRAGFDLAKDSDEQLIERLGSGNGYDREIALRLLTERLASGQAGPDTRELLEVLALGADAARTPRLNAAWALIGSDSLRPEILDRLLAHPDSTFRAWGVRAAGDRKALAEARRPALLAMAADPSPDVLVQVAAAGPKIAESDGQAAATLAQVFAAGASDRVVPHVAWQNLHPRLDGHAGPLLDRLADGLEGQGGAWTELLPRLVERMADTDEPDLESLARLFEILARDPAARRAELVAFLGAMTDAANDGELAAEAAGPLVAVLFELSDRVRALGAGDPINQPLRAESQLLFAALRGGPDPARAEELLDAQILPSLGEMIAGTWRIGDDTRVRALDTLARLGESEIALDALEKTAADPESGSPELRGRLLSESTRIDAPATPVVLLGLFPQVEPALKPRIIEVLTSRPAWAKALIDAVEAKEIPSSSLNVNQLRRLQSNPDKALAARARAAFGTVREGRNEQRELVVAQMRRHLRETPGDPVAGRSVFDRVCAQCHQIYGTGQEVGPDLTGSGRNDWDQMISNVFDPSLVIGEAYQAVTAATTDGRVLTGLLAEDSPQRIALKVQGGKLEIIPRADLDEMQVSPVSLMPEDLEKQLSPQELADLFSFLALDRPPGDPEARLLPGAPRPKE